MFCKNCGKEIKEGSAFCPECGAKAESNASVQANQIDIGAFQSAMANSRGSVAVKKKSKGKFILIGVFAVLIIIVIACAMGDNENAIVIEADNFNGMSFNYDLSEWCDRFNESLKKVDNEFGTETNIKIKSTSFQLDNTDYDTTDANVVRYYYENSKSNYDFAISLYVDTDTEKVCKCEIVNALVNGDDLTLFEHFCLIPAVMATSHIDYDTARSTLKNLFSSEAGNHCKYYNNNICYQFGSTSTYDITNIQPVSQEVYDEKY